MINRNDSGYALLEILLAFSVATIVIMGMVSLGISTVRALTASQAYSEAGKIAQREVERLKLLRDAVAWGDASSGFYQMVSTNCLSPSICHVDAGFTNVMSGSASETIGGTVITYYITATAATLPTPRVNYVVTTSWTIGSGAAKSYTIEGVLTNWKEV